MKTSAHFDIVTPNDWNITHILNKGIKNFVFCDFDDVLNFFPQTYNKKLDDVHPHRAQFTTRVDFKKYKINYDLDVLQELNTILQKPDTILVWLTSWRKHVQLVSTSMNITTSQPEIVLNYKDTGHHVADKTDAMKTILAKIEKHFHDNNIDYNSLSFVWLDDKAVPSKNFRAQILGKFDQNFLLIQPFENIGLTMNHMTEIKNFLNIS